MPNVTDGSNGGKHRCAGYTWEPTQNVSRTAGHKNPAYHFRERSPPLTFYVSRLMCHMSQVTI